MPYGYLTEAQKKAIEPYLTGKAVHDLGAGDYGLAEELLRLGAERIIGIDRFIPVDVQRDNPQIRYIEGYFHDFKEPVQTAFMSWPVNWHVGLVPLLKGADTIIYLGSNYGGSCCGSPDLWEHLLTRRVLVEIPHFKNTLLVYGSERVIREPRPEEFAATNLSKMYQFEELYGQADRRAG